MRGAGVLSDAGGGGGNGGDTGTPLLTSPVPSITIAGETYSTDERELELESMGLTDEDIQDLKYMVNLTRLTLSNNNITDLTPLKDLTLLRNLRLDGNDITDVSPLAGITSRIPPDQVLDAMAEVGRALPRSLRETGTGGLAATPFARERFPREL